MIRLHYAPFVEERPTSRLASPDIRTVIDEHGREVLDIKPVSVPISDYVPPSSLLELVHQLYRDMQSLEHETFEDADDFDVPDELGIEMESTPYEQDFDYSAGGPAASEEPAAVPVEPEKVAE